MPKRSRPQFKRQDATVGTMMKRQRGLPRVVQQSLMYRKVRPEYKATDVIVQSQAVTSAAIIQDLTDNLVRGNSQFNNFVGGTIDPISITVKIQLVAGESNSLIPVGPDTNNITRIVVFQWLGDTVPLVGDIFQNTGGQATQSGWNMSNIDKLNILMDRQYATYLTTFQSNALSTTVSGNCIADKAYIKGRKMAPINFSQNGLVPAGNNLFFIYVADSSLQPHPTLTANIRLTFID